MATRPHKRFIDLARRHGARSFDSYWEDQPRRLVTVAEFKTGDLPKLIFRVTYSDGKVEMSKLPERDRDYPRDFSLEDFNDNLEMMLKIRDFIEEVQS